MSSRSQAQSGMYININLQLISGVLMRATFIRVFHDEVHVNVTPEERNHEAVIANPLSQF